MKLLLRTEVMPDLENQDPTIHKESTNTRLDVQETVDLEARLVVEDNTKRQTSGTTVLQQERCSLHCNSVSLWSETQKKFAA